MWAAVVISSVYFITDSLRPRLYLRKAAAKLRNPLQHKASTGKNQGLLCRSNEQKLSYWKLEVGDSSTSLKDIVLFLCVFLTHFWGRRRYLSLNFFIKFALCEGPGSCAAESLLINATERSGVRLCCICFKTVWSYISFRHYYLRGS